jgi:hypothetical protein
LVVKINWRYRGDGSVEGLGRGVKCNVDPMEIGGFQWRVYREIHGVRFESYDFVPERGLGQSMCETVAQVMDRMGW